MKRVRLSSAVVWGACTVLLLAGRGFAAGGAASLPVPLDGNALLEKSEAVYAALPRYAGTSEVTTRLQVEGRWETLTETSRIQFTRPDRLRAERTTQQTGQQVTVIGDGRRAWYSLGADEPFRPEKRLRSLHRTLGSGAAIPAALMKLSGDNPFGLWQSSQLEDTELIEGHACYRVKALDGDEQRTYWIDTETFLLRQLEVKRTEAEVRHLFRPEAAPPVMPAALFQRPAKVAGPDPVFEPLPPLARRQEELPRMRLSARHPASTARLRALGTALTMHYNDYDERLPALTSLAAARKTLGPYQRLVMPGQKGDLLTDPESGVVYVPNAALSGKRLHELAEPAQIVVFYEGRPAADGSRGVVLADGSGRRVPPADWVKLKARSRIP